MFDKRTLPPRNGLFDVAAPVWERLAGRWGMGAVVARLELSGTERLVDLGGGVGRLARHVDGAARAVVLDPSAPMTRQGRRRGRTVTRARAEAIPLADGSCERVVVLDALHHMEQIDRAAAEIARVLAPGGRAVLFEPDPESFAGAWIARLERWAGMRSLLLDGDSLCRLFAGHGLSGTLERQSAHLLLSLDKPGGDAAHP